MYGYVRPFKPDLTFRQYDRYKAAYCGLCHALSARFGFAARFAVSFDMTLPALFQKEAAYCQKACPARPLKQCQTLANGPFLEKIADASMILAWHKLADQQKDQGFLGRLGGRLLSFLLKRAYQKAAAYLPAFDESCQSQLARLHKLEEENCAVPDEAADCFALLLAGLSFLADGPEEERIFRDFFYHIGRVVYLLDAYDDAYDDAQKGRYNPLMAKFGKPLSLTEEVRQELAETIELSLARSSAALALLPAGENTGVLENILYKGLPAVVRTVISVPCTAEGAKQKRRMLSRKEREL